MNASKQEGKHLMKSAFFSVALAKYTTLAVGIVFSAIMARLLTPDDYGVFAVVNLFVAFFCTASDLGIGAAVIQKLFLSEDDINHIYTFTAGLGMLFGIVMVFIGIPLSMFYANQAYLVLCPLISISVFLYAVNIVPNAVLLRAGRYKEVAVRNVVVSVVSLTVALGMAFAGCKYYALAGQSLVTFIMYYAWNQHSAKLRFVWELGGICGSVKKIASYSAYQFAGDLAYYMELNIDNFTVGAALGSTQLAYYDKAYRLLDYPVGNLAGTLNTVLHPMLKDYQDKQEIMKEKVLFIERVFSLISVFLVAACCICSSEAVGIIYGKQWGKSVLTFRIMSFAIYPKMLLSTLNTVFTSLGDTKLLFRTQLKRLAVTFSFIIASACFGKIEAVAVAVVLSSWLDLLLAFYVLLKKGFHTDGKIFLGKFGRDIAVMCVLTFGGFLVAQYLPDMDFFVGAVIKGAVIFTIYMAYLFASGDIALLAALLPRRGDRNGG